MHVVQHVLGDSHIFENARCRKVLSDFDLHIAKVSLACYPLALLLVWVVRLGRPRCAPFQSAIPVVRGEWFALVPLGGAVGVDVINVGEIDLEPRRSCFLVVGSKVRRSRAILHTVLRSR